MNKRKIITIIILLIVIIAGLIIFYTISANRNTIIVPEYEEYEVQTGSISQVVNLSGTIEPAQTARIFNGTDYSIIKDNYSEGDWVNKGDILYELNTFEVEKKISAAKSELEKASDNYTYYQNEYNNYGIYATMAGVISDLNIKLGDYIVDGTSIGTAYNFNAPIISFNFVENVKINTIADSTRIMLSVNENEYKGTLETFVCDTNAITTEHPDELEYSNGSENSDEFLKNITLSFTEEISLQVGDKVIVNSQGNNFEAIVSDITYEKESIIASNSGYVRDIKKTTNTSFRSGDILLLLSNDEIEHNVTQYKLLLQDAQKELDNQKKELSSCTIKAPISGKIIKKYENMGYFSEVTDSNTPMMIIADTSSYIVKAFATPKDVQSLQVGQEVEITSNVIKGFSVKGKIANINNMKSDEIDDDGYEVNILPDIIDTNINQFGIEVYVNIKTIHKDNIIIIPVNYISDGNTVYVENSDNPNEHYNVSVQTGISNNEYVEIISGLDVGMKLKYFTNIEDDSA